VRLDELPGVDREMTVGYSDPHNPEKIRQGLIFGNMVSAHYEGLPGTIDKTAIIGEYFNACNMIFAWTAGGIQAS
jgi:hypothetical protein